MTRRTGGPAAPASPAAITRPMDEDMRDVVESAGDPRLVPAFVNMGFFTIPHLLSAQASFMASPTIPDDELDALCEDIQRVRDASTPPSSLCGGYAAFADDGGAFRLLRLIIYNARMRLQRAASAVAAPAAPVVPAPVEDTQKPLPPNEIEDLWQAGKRVTAGYASVLPKHRLSDGVVSRMVRNNKAGQLWLPAIDRSFLYKEASSNLVITTLLKCSGDHSCPAQPGASSDVSIQMVQGGQLAERFDPVRLVADYIALLSHRSAAVIACYCTPKAAAAYQASGVSATLQSHSECAVDGQCVLITPAFVGALERKLREATRYGMSTAEVLAMDQRVIAAVHERMNNVAVDGNLAVEYVCDQRESLFRTDVSTSVSLDQLGSSLHGSSTSGHAQSIAPSDSISCAQQSSRGGSSSEVERLRKVNSKLQSERDLAINDLKRKRSGGGGGSSSRSEGPRRDAASVRGGTSGRSGGGDDRGSQICRHYNMPNGCYRTNCQHRHVCDKPVGRDRVCGDYRHNACTHWQESAAPRVSCLRHVDVEVDAVYWSCVDRLEAELIFSEPYVRPQAKMRNAPLDQASQRPQFSSSTARGSPEAFLAWESQRPHPSHVSLPRMDADLEAAISFVAFLGVHVVDERRRRMAILQEVSTVLEPLSSRVCLLMSESSRDIARAMALNVERRTRPDARLDDMHGALYSIHFGLLGAILDALRWPDQHLVRKLVCGFKSVGDVPDSGVWRPVARPASQPFHVFAQSNASWVSECKARVLAAARKSPERARACYERTCQELDDGLILGPYSVNDLNAKPGTWRFAFGFGRWRPLPRFAIWQGTKWRCIDDAAVSGTNDCGTTTYETIVCDRPDLPLRIGLRFHELGVPVDGVTSAVDMGGGADDAFAAYRRATSADMAYTVVMVPVPSGDCWGVQCFCVPGHNFGLTSAVLNFNCIPEPLVRFSRRFLCVPVVRFYDDESVHEPAYAGGSGQSSHVLFREVLRFHFDVGKHQPWSSTPVFCGVCTDWSAERQGRVSIGVTAARRAKLVSRIDDIIAAHRLSPAEASSLRGKCRFCLAPVFGRMGVAILSTLRQRQYVDKSSEMTDELLEALRALRAAVVLFPNFSVPIQRLVCPPVVILSDASWEVGHTWIGFVVMCPVNGCRWAGVPTPEWLLQWLARLRAKQTYIGQLEVAAALAPYWSLPASVFRDRAVSHYVDNQGALYSLIHGRSSDVDANRLVFLARLRLHVLRADAWFDYVPSASNIADLPTRLDSSAEARLLVLGPCVPCVLPPMDTLVASWENLVSLVQQNL